MDSFKVALKQTDVFPMSTSVATSAWSIEGDDANGLDGSQVSVKQPRPTRNKAKRKNYDVTNIQNGRPPTQHAYRPNTPGSKFSPSVMGSQNVFITENSYSGPMSARSMSLALDEIRSTVSEDALVHALNDATSLDTENNVKRDDKKRFSSKTKFIAGFLVLFIVCAIEIIATVVVLMANDRKGEKDTDKKGDSGSFTLDSPLMTPTDDLTTRPNPSDILTSQLSTTNNPLMTDHPTNTPEEANGLLDILFAIDSLPGDFVRSSRDIRGFCEEILNGLELGVDDAIVTLGTSDYGGLYFSEALYDGIFNYFDDHITTQPWRLSYGLVEVIEAILNDRTTGPDGTRVPRDDATDVVIVFSEGYSTGEAHNFVQRIEPRARVILVGTANANWANLNQFNSNPNDRFDIDQVDEVLRALRTI